MGSDATALGGASSAPTREGTTTWEASMRFGMRIIAVLATLSLLAAACGGDGNDTGASGADDGGLGAQTGPTASTGATGSSEPGAGSFYPPTGSTGTTGATGASGAEADVQVSLNNYLFDPDPVEVAEGDVVAVRNANTRTPHTFTVVGEDVDLELGPMETETVQITLAPGTYHLICRFHEALGMKATLKVT